MIDNGKRVRVSLSDFEGEAGFVRRESGAELAYIANRGVPSRVGATVDADDDRWTVESVVPSKYVRGMTVVRLRKA